MVFDGFNSLVCGLYQQGTTPNMSLFAGSSAPSSNPDPALNTWSVVQTFFSGASSFITTDANAPVTGNPGAGNMGGVTLGARGGAGSFFGAVSFREFIVYPAQITGADLTNLYAYLAAVRDA
jgi:hypothetical protein